MSDFYKNSHKIREKVVKLQRKSFFPNFMELKLFLRKSTFYESKDNEKLWEKI